MSGADQSTGKRSFAPFVAALVLTAGITPLPILASIITAAIYITQAPQALLKLRTNTIGNWLGPQWTTIVAGLVLTLILWVLLSICTQKATGIDSVNAMNALHLKNHLSTLKVAFDALPKPGCNSKASSSHREDQQQYCTAHRQVGEYIQEIENEISYKDVRWVTARGYLKAWNLLHRAEEAMIVLQPSDEVIREAWHDEMSCKGSGIGCEADALHKLRTAVIILSPSAAVYLNKAENATSSFSATSSTSGNVGEIEIEARDALRDARKTLNEYRGRLWEGLVSQRNQLMATTFITGLFTYFLLLFAIIGGAFPMTIEAAAAFYLAGALSGLFIRLYRESTAEQAVDDFNLSTVRILVTPFISGLAAVGGILLLATLTITITQSASNTSASTAIAAAFNLNQNGLGIVMATIFGYAPNLFVDALQQRAQDVTTQLQNSTPQNQGTAAPGTPAQLATIPASLTFIGVVGQPNPQAQPITLTNSGGGTLVWQAAATTTVGGAWLSHAPPTGSISSMQTGSISVTAAVISGLNPGIYTGTITITATDSVTNQPVGTPQVIIITLNVMALTVSPATFTFNVTTGISSQPITIGNSGGQPLNWSADIAPGAPPFVSLSATSGSNLAGGANTSTNVIVDATGVTGSQTFTTSVTVSAVNPSTGQATAGSPSTVAITINIAAPAMQLSTTSLHFTATQGGSNPPLQTLSITNSGGDGLNWTVGAQSAKWLTMTPTSGSDDSGASSELTFAVDISNLEPGSYPATVTITPSTGSPATVNVDLTVNTAQPPTS